jgi:CO/xanthine dehydrogenase FAD-binding subunit
MDRYLRPINVGEALAALDAGARTIIAGGTDYYPARVGKPLDEDILDVTALHDLGRIEDTDDAYRIGALVTWSDILRADLPPWFDALKGAAREVGGVQVQNAGTLVGNLCNASPAADGVPVLMSYDASVELTSVEGTRRVPLENFITGNRATVRAANELVAGIVVPKPKRDARSTFLKLGARRYLVISIAMVSAVLEEDAVGKVAAARIAVGACSEVATRLAALEEDLIGQECSPVLADIATPLHLSGLSPIDDIRGPGAYRRDAALTLVKRALSELGGAT